MLKAFFLASASCIHTVYNYSANIGTYPYYLLLLIWLYVLSTVLCSDILVGWLIGWLNWLNAELCPTRYWWGPTSQEFGGEKDNN